MFLSSQLSVKNGIDQDERVIKCTWLFGIVFVNIFNNQSKILVEWLEEI